MLSITQTLLSEGIIDLATRLGARVVTRKLNNKMMGGFKKLDNFAARMKGAPVQSQQPPRPAQSMPPPVPSQPIQPQQQQQTQMKTQPQQPQQQPQQPR